MAFLKIIFMNSFLYRVAKAYYHQYDTDILNYTFVFPNRRAGLFFQKYLSELIDKPVFSPAILTVNDCFFNASQRRVADRTRELFRLYSIYRQVSSSDEPFDTFLYWGEILLADFNEVDKYRIDARQLFTNVKDLKDLDLFFDVFTDEQKSAIKHFWENFIPIIEGKTKEEFIATWRILLPLYEEFRRQLFAENTATEGMIFREVSEQLKRKEDPDYFSGKKFVFVGFNALNPCEKLLFTELQKRGQADFYWDYEAAELRDSNNQASLFYKENIQNFHSALQLDIETPDLKNKSWELISMPSAVGQTKEIYRLLNELYPDRSEDKNWIKTAVVLPDESMLVPLLHSLPPSIEKINVTMGFPLNATPVSSLLENIFELQRRMNKRQQFYHHTVSGILNHQYIHLLCSDDAVSIAEMMIRTNAMYVEPEAFNKNELLAAIFTPHTSSVGFVEYLLDILKKLNIAWQNKADAENDFRLECDFLFQYYISLNRLNEVITSVADTAEITIDTLLKLVRQLIGGISIPFEGEPLNGLQIMGMLETRGLDFENLIICSFNEGVFPKKSTSNSFIPYNLRKAFNLPTAEYHDAISAYNFYRLISGARRLIFLYDSRNEGAQTGEVSRYIHQLRYHYGVQFQLINIAYDIRTPSDRTMQVEKTPEVMAKLQPYLSDANDAPALSATSLNSYIDCPLQFYLTQVEQMREPEEVQETIEAGMFGTLLHAVMEGLYKSFEGKTVHKTALEELWTNPLTVDRAIRTAFSENYFMKGKNPDLVLEGNYLLVARVIRKYVIQILKKDAENSPFNYIQSERKERMRFPIHGGESAVNLKGFIDRVDERQGVTRILDYKTGSGSLEFKSPDDVFKRNMDKRPKFVLQTFLYCLLYGQGNDTDQIVPEILYIRDLFKTNFSTRLIDKSGTNGVGAVDNFEEYKSGFISNLTVCLEEIFNPEIPFAQCTNAKTCEYCPYKVICRR